MIHTVRLAVPHGIVFLIDPMNVETVVPDHVPGVIVASNQTCISVGTQSDMDGDTEIVLGKPPLPTDGLIKRGETRIHAPGGMLAVVTSHLQRIMEVRVPPGDVAVDVWTDDPVSPTRIAIEVKEQRPP